MICWYYSNLAFSLHLAWNGFVTKVSSFVCSCSCVHIDSVWSYIGLSDISCIHHLRCDWGRCLTFEVASSSLVEEQQPTHMTFTSAFKVALLSPHSPAVPPSGQASACWLLQASLPSADKLYLLPREPAAQPVAIRHAGEDGRGEQTRQGHFQTV